MDMRLGALAGRQGGTFSVHQAHALGVGDVELRRATLSGELIRVRRGAYIDGKLWSAADRDERYRLTVMAVARSRPGDVVSHQAAAALHGLPLWDLNPGRVDLHTDIRQAVHRPGLCLHPRAVEPATLVGDLPVVSVARAVVGTALTSGLTAAVVAGDFALHEEMVTEAELFDEVALVTPHQGRARALEAVVAMDGKSESVGESRTRLVLDTLGLTVISQFVVRDQTGSVVARVDFLVEGVVVEFDGKVKYRGEGKDAAEAVWLEKRREDRIRRLGYPVERVVWDDLERPGRLGARIRAARPAA